MESSLNVIRESDHWVFELNRPDKRNALSEALIESLITAVEEAHDADIPLLVFKGAGKNFSAGFDFGGFEESSEGDLLLRRGRRHHLGGLVRRNGLVRHSGPTGNILFRLLGHGGMRRDVLRWQSCTCGAGVEFVVGARQPIRFGRLAGVFRHVGHRAQRRPKSTPRAVSRTGVAARPEPSVTSDP